MKLEHVAIWTHKLESLKNFYVRYFGGKANTKYDNPDKGFQSYFLTFDSGARLELMYKPDIPEKNNDAEEKKHLGITHLAFGLMACLKLMKKDGYKILSGPGKTGDGYYEFEALDPDNNRLEVTTLFIE
jgi:lactoylglutathione lyase